MKNLKIVEFKVFLLLLLVDVIMEGSRSGTSKTYGSCGSGYGSTSLINTCYLTFIQLVVVLFVCRFASTCKDDLKIYTWKSCDRYASLFPMSLVCIFWLSLNWCTVYGWNPVFSSQQLQDAWPEIRTWDLLLAATVSVCAEKSNCGMILLKKLEKTNLQNLHSQKELKASWKAFADLDLYHSFWASRIR